VYGNEPPKGGTEIEPGDLNGDGSIDALDYAMMKKYILRPDGEVDLAVWDLNKDGEVNVLDLVAMKKLLGL
jgi:hypothetical protein